MKPALGVRLSFMSISDVVICYEPRLKQAAILIGSMHNQSTSSFTVYKENAVDID